MQFNRNQMTPGAQYMQFQQNMNRGVPKVESVKTVTETRCITIDSRDRNRARYANSNKFRVKFNPGKGELDASLLFSPRKVISIRLAECVLPAIAKTYRYITLVIPEIEDTMIGTGDKVRKSFTTLVPTNYETGTGDWIRIQAKDLCNCMRTFDPPKERLSNLTFEFYSPDETLVDFGTDTSAPTAPNENVQVFMVFEIKMEVPNKHMLRI